eukprot:scaffold12768_cov58-Cylindrotheca_fusiformis.AAC.1
MDKAGMEENKDQDEGIVGKAMQMGANTIEMAKGMVGMASEEANEAGAKTNETAKDLKAEADKQVDTDGIVETAKEIGVNTVEQAKEIGGN